MEKFDNSFNDTSFPIKTQAIPTQKILIQKLRQPQEDDIPEHAFSSREDIQINKTLTNKPQLTSGQPTPRKSRIIENFFIFGVKRFLRKSAQDRFIKHTRRASNNLRISDLNALQQEVVLTLLNIQKQSQNIFSRIPVFESTNPLLIFYDGVYLLTILFSFFWLPYEVSFAPSNNNIFLALNIFLIVLIVADSILLLHRSMIYKGRIVTDKMKILQLQGKIKLPFAILQFICLMVQNIIDYVIIREMVVILFMIFVVPRLGMAINACANFFNFGVKVRDILSLGKMIFYLIHIVHMIACIWHMIGAYNDTSGQTWLERYRYLNVSNGYKYTVSFYWAAMTMTTVGYGDITPQNQQEYAFANLVMVVACVVFAYTMNRIGALLTNIDQRQSEFRQNKELFDIYLKKNKVGHELQSKIQSYLEYLSNVEDEKNVTVVNNMMTKLTDQLRLELQQNIRGSLIENCPSLKGFSRQLKTELCSLVQEVCVPPNEEVIEPSKQDDQSLYLIQEGQVQYFPHLQKKINHLLISQGGSFGEISFFTGQARTLKINTTKLCIFQKISLEDFLNLLNRYPQDKEYYFFVRDNLMYKKNYKIIDLKCLCCQQSHHMISECPFLKLCIDREKIIKAHLFPVVNSRHQFNRRAKRRIHAVFNYGQRNSNNSWAKTKIENDDDNRSFDSQQSESEDQDQVVLNQTAQEQYAHARTSLRKRFSNQVTITDTIGRSRCSNTYENNEYHPQKSNNLTNRLSRESKLIHHESLFKIKPLITIDEQKYTPESDGPPTFTHSPINSVNHSYGGYTSNYQTGSEFQFNLLKEFDLMVNFSKFYPEYNQDSVIQRLYPKDIMKASRKSKMLTFSKYTFDYEMAKKYLNPRQIRRKSKKQSRAKNETKMIESKH